MRTITTIGLDIAKSVFQVHGVDAVGQVVIRRPEAAIVPGRHGGLRLIASLVARTPGAGPHRSPDAAGLCEALREAAQE